MCGKSSHKTSDRELPQFIKNVYKIPTTNMVLNNETPNAEAGNKAKMSTHITGFQ